MSTPLDTKKPLPDITLDAPPAYEATATSQPTAIKQMTVGTARNPKALEVGLDGKRDWNYGLCGCLDRPGLTLAACVCPCSVWATNHTRMQHLAAKGTPNPSPERVGLLCGLYALSPNILGIGQVVMQCFSRYSTRERYGVRGSPLEDVLVASFCTTCSLVQEYREIEEEEMALQEGATAVPEALYRDDEV